MLPIHGIIHVPHLVRRDFSAKLSQGLSNFWMFHPRGVAYERHGVIGWEVMPVVFENNQAERLNEPICRVARNQIHLPRCGGFVSKPEIHHAGRTRKPQAVCLRETWIAIL